jgi:hypothetical protein
MSNLSLLYEKDFSNWTARTVDLLRQGRFTKRTGVKEDRGQKKDRGQVFPFSFRERSESAGLGVRSLRSPFAWFDLLRRQSC